MNSDELSDRICSWIWACKLIESTHSNAVEGRDAIIQQWSYERFEEVAMLEVPDELRGMPIEGHISTAARLARTNREDALPAISAHLNYALKGLSKRHRGRAADNN